MYNYVYIWRSEPIPYEHLDEVLELRRFIRDKLNIRMTVHDVYRLWCDVSASWDAGWLRIDTHYEGETREEFLMDQINRYCRRTY